MARLRRVFIDTSELSRFTVIDVLPTKAEARLYNSVWTGKVLDERQEVIVREGHRTSVSAASVAEAVRSYFGRFRIRWPSSRLRSFTAFSYCATSPPPRRTA